MRRNDTFLLLPDASVDLNERKRSDKDPAITYRLSTLSLFIIGETCMDSGVVTRTRCVNLNRCNNPLHTNVKEL